MIFKSEFINAVRVDFKKFSGFFFLFLFVSIPCGLKAASAQPYERETPVVRAVRMVSSAVVNISSEYEVRERPYPFSGGGDTFFDFFFRDFFDPGFDRKYRRTSLGSGVIIDGEKGFILTNAHVIQSAGAITVMLNDEREFEAKVKGLDPESDLAVLQIESEAPLPSVGMGNSEDLMIGETVIAIGNPFGFSHTVTTGVISAVDRSVRTDDAVYHNFIQDRRLHQSGEQRRPAIEYQRQADRSQHRHLRQGAGDRLCDSHQHGQEDRFRSDSFRGSGLCLDGNRAAVARFSPCQVSGAS